MDFFRNYMDCNICNYRCIYENNNKKNKINKVRQGIIAYEDRNPDFEIGFETPDASSYAHVVNEKNKKRTIIRMF